MTALVLTPGVRLSEMSDWRRIEHERAVAAANREAARRVITGAHDSATLLAALGYTDEETS